MTGAAMASRRTASQTHGQRRSALSPTSRASCTSAPLAMASAGAPDRQRIEPDGAARASSTADAPVHPRPPTRRTGLLDQTPPMQTWPPLESGPCSSRRHRRRDRPAGRPWSHSWDGISFFLFFLGTRSLFYFLSRDPIAFPFLSKVLCVKKSRQATKQDLSPAWFS
jgi:hypothetical protein